MTNPTAAPAADTPEQQDVHRRAIDAAMAVFDRDAELMPGPSRRVVAEALAAAEAVYAAAEDARVDALMEQTGFAGMDVEGSDIRITVKHAAEIAAGMVKTFDELLNARGAENYLEWHSTVTDPAREQALKAGVPYDQLPQARVYKLYIVRPDRPTPHELRRAAEAHIDAAAALCADATLLDPRQVLLALGRPPACSCPGGLDGWLEDFDPDCPRHGVLEATPGEIRGLLPAAREAMTWAVGAWVPVYHDDPNKTPRDGQLANVLANVLAALRSPARRDQHGEEA